MRFSWRFWRSRRRRDHLSRGHLGEDHAARYLLSRGLRVLERNVRTPAGEIDLIALEGETTLVFVEVKTRRLPCPARPSRAVTRAKQRRLSRAVDAYYLRRPRQRSSCGRFDVVEIYLDRHDQVERIEWLRSAFEYVRRG